MVDLTEVGELDSLRVILLQFGPFSKLVETIFDRSVVSDFHSELEIIRVVFVEVILL